MKKTDLKNYAKLIVRMGANVQKGQDVVISSFVENSEFVALVAEEAYKAKARSVSVDWSCDKITKLAYKNESIAVLSDLPNWRVERLLHRRDTLPAMIYISSEDPDALKGVSQEKMMEVRKNVGKVFRPIRKQMENKYQWTIAAIPSLRWAKKVFPELSNKQAVEALWDAIFKCARAYGNPISNWEKHNAYLKEKYEKLNAMNIQKLIYKSQNGTDFEVKLIKDVIFMAGGANTISGVYYNPNMPTEECFTTPNKYSANGTVFASKPLSLNGLVIKDFGFKFKDGKVVEILAKDDLTKNALESLTSVDEGASRLGEVALVPFNSPVNETGLLFYNTLFDENACCHLALGMGFEDCIRGFENMTKEEIDKFDLNDSIIHVDFMIGTSDLSIKGELENGSLVDIFEGGTWAI